ncbi:MAG: hypothetical protein HZA77_04800 [Candidatus Schekmanbacteria bacterium]|nr:hypothetical protein [Candidatus Schekmanbacteria bacterium]
MLGTIERNLDGLLEEARLLSWKRFGKKITLYLPGMIRCGSETGLYPAVSVSGGECTLSCEHCRGKVLEPMIEATSGENLLSVCKRLKKGGNLGVLLTGGSDSLGRVGWERFAGTIRKIKEETGLHVSIHTGFLDLKTAILLKEAGVDQALTDVIGNSETLKNVYHLENGTGVIDKTLDALYKAQLPMVPHIVAGLDFGKIKGEFEAVNMLKKYNPPTLVIVTLTPFAGTPMEECKSPEVDDVARLMAYARLSLPQTEISLGCEHPRNRMGIELEKYAILAGANRIAVYSDEAIELAGELGIEIRYAKTCCSVMSLT